MLARGADPDSQDSNGNTVLHMLVIYKKLATFDMAYEMGANISFRNNQYLTPLTLAAKLARVELFFHIMNIEREIYWQIGSITCAAYPLAQIDTIDIETGNISKDSALNLVVFGDKDEHLELMDGVLVDLLNAKWNAFVKFRFYRQFIFFTCYFFVSMLCFILRPGPDTVIKSVATTNSTIAMTTQSISSPSITITSPLPFQLLRSDNITDFMDPYNITDHDDKFTTSETSQQSLENKSEPLYSDIKFLKQKQMQNLHFLLNLQYRKTNINISLFPMHKNIENLTRKQNISLSSFYKDHNIMYTNHERMNDSKPSYSNAIGTSNENSIPMVNITRIHLTLPPEPTKEPKFRIDFKKLWQDIAGDCRYLETDSTAAIVRLCAELVMEIGAALYIVAALREARFLGLHMFIENLMTAPSRVMFLFSCLLMLIMPTLRFTCNEQMEDIVVVVIMLTTAPYFLFFCRGFKTVGPFVVMIYRMVMGDLLRFGSIYLVFVMGFSQAYYIIFLSFDNPLTPDGVDDSVSNPLPNPIEAVMAMFFISLTNFGDYYTAFDRTEHQAEAKLLFVIYMGIVAVLLVNMLIAMMGNTYQKIAETRNEWQRQWARIVLVVERGVSPSERLTKLMWYSQPMSDGRRALVLRLNQTEEDKEEMKEILEMKRVHLRMVQKRKTGKQVLVQTPSPQRLSTTV